MNTTIKGGIPLKGTICPPPSKSTGHRAIICAALAKGTSTITNIGYSEDIHATIDAMKNLGAQIEQQGSTLIINGESTLNNIQSAIVNCNESGSTLRFLIPLALHCHQVTYTGKEGLAARPLTTYYNLFKKWGIEYYNEDGKLPLTVKGGAVENDIFIEGNISSQFISGLLFALPLMQGEYTIHITSKMESKGYIDLTLQMLEKYGIIIINNNYESFYIKGGQEYKPCDYVCEGDFSQAAFYLVAGTIGSDLICEGLNPESRQGDKAIVTIINSMGGNIVKTDNGLKPVPSKTTGITIDASQIPDLVPILALLAVFSDGDTHITNAARLRIKESDRLTTTAAQLNTIGANIEELDDGLIIHGTGCLKGGIANSCNDHRIAMMLAVAATRCDNDLTIEDSGSVKKSYPHFWEDYKKLGGNIS